MFHKYYSLGGLRRPGALRAPYQNVLFCFAKEIQK